MKIKEKVKRQKLSSLAMVFLILSVWVFMDTTGVLLDAAESSLNGRDIMLKVDNRPDGTDRKFLLEMTLINKRNRKRVRTVLSYSKDYGNDKKTIMYFEKPADVKGTGFLSYEYDEPSKEDDRWLYLPALKKVRRISGSSKNDYFMGTDFTYDDMGDRSVDEDTHQLLREEALEGHSCWVVESVAKDKSYMYSKKIGWVRKDSLIATKVEFYDRRGTLIKTLTVPVQEKVNGFWTALKMVMDNTSKEHKTLLEMKEVQYDQGIKDSLFRVSTLQRGRI
jgi:outer membrane lipoprotein-sorting protein